MKWLTDWFDVGPRPAQLLSMVLATIYVALLLDAWNGWPVWDQLFYPETATVAKVRFWSALLYGLAFVLGLPVAFLLWFWRDTNVRDQIENARKDINLKEFQEVQLRAAGALDEKLPEEAREQLQIAALHQLSGFLSGKYGESFPRPAFELLMAGHAAAIHRIGVPEVQAQITSAISSKTRAEIEKAIETLRGRLSRVDRERMTIIEYEFDTINAAGFPLYSRRFDLLTLTGRKFRKNVMLAGSHFFGTDLSSVSLERGDLRFAHFEGANLSNAHLEHVELYGAHLQGAFLHSSKLKGAYLYDVHLEYANLNGADLKGASLTDAHLEGASLRHAHLEGASLYQAHLEGTDLSSAHLERASLYNVYLDGYSDWSGAQFDAATNFGSLTIKNWSDLSDAEKDSARALWIEYGAIYVDAPASDTNN